MPTVGVFDHDFFTYTNVIPSLECAKLIAYYRSRRDITVLTPNFSAPAYTKYFFQKNYDDGIDASEFLLPNVSYGGHFFSGERYNPLPLDIEYTAPNMSAYESYEHYFTGGGAGKNHFRTIISGLHGRISLDGKTIDPKLIDVSTIDARTKTLILHDYDIGRIPQAYEYIKEIAYSKYVKTKDDYTYLRLGNKFPLQITNPTEFEHWAKLQRKGDFYNFQYNGIMPDEFVASLPHYTNLPLLIDFLPASLFTKNDFLENELRQIFTQVLFLRRNGIQILLNYEDSFDIPQEIKNLFVLLNHFLSFDKKFNEQMDSYNKYLTFHSFCKILPKIEQSNTYFIGRKNRVSRDEMIDAFQYVREKCYALFRMFYTWADVTYQGGEFCNGFKRY